MAFKQAGRTGSIADVDTDGNALVNMPLDPKKAGFVIPASVDGVPFEATEDGHALVSEDTIVLFDQIDGNAVNTNIWNPYDVSGMTIAQSGGFITLNAGLATTANAWALLKSIKHIPLYPEFPTFIAFDIKVNVAPQANVTIEVGIGNPSGAGALADGVLYRFASDATLKGITNNGGSETATAPMTALATNVMHDLDLLIEVGDCEFEVDDDTIIEIPNAAGLPFCVGTTRLPIFMRVINGSSPPGTAPQISLGRISVIQKVLKPNRDWAESLAVLGRGAYQSPVTGFGQTANHANSTNPTSAALSNTAAGYTTLGGRYQFAAVAGAVTDFALFAYQVPAGFQLFVRNIVISCANTGAIGSAITPTIIDWSVGVNSSAVSLATADGTNTWAPRRIPLGMQTFALSVAVGSAAPDISRSFDPQLVVDSGRYLHIIMQIPVAAATASEIFRGDVMINGYLE